MLKLFDNRHVSNYVFCKCRQAECSFKVAFGLLSSKKSCNGIVKTDCVNACSSSSKTFPDCRQKLICVIGKHTSWKLSTVLGLFLFGLTEPDLWRLLFTNSCTGGEEGWGWQSAQLRHQGHGGEDAEAAELSQLQKQRSRHEPHGREQASSVAVVP